MWLDKHIWVPLNVVSFLQNPVDSAQPSYLHDSLDDPSKPRSLAHVLQTA